MGQWRLSGVFLFTCSQELLVPSLTNLSILYRSAVLHIGQSSSFTDLCPSSIFLLCLAKSSDTLNRLRWSMVRTFVVFLSSAYCALHICSQELLVPTLPILSFCLYLYTFLFCPFPYSCIWLISSVNKGPATYCISLPVVSYLPPSLVKSQWFGDFSSPDDASPDCSSRTVRPGLFVPDCSSLGLFVPRTVRPAHCSHRGLFVQPKWNENNLCLRRPLLF